MSMEQLLWIWLFGSICMALLAGVNHQMVVSCFKWFVDFCTNLGRKLSNRINVL